MVRLLELGREVAFQSLVVGGVSTVLDGACIICSPHSRRIVPDREVGHFVLIFDAELLLVSATGQNITVICTVFCDEGLLSTG